MIVLDYKKKRKTVTILYVCHSRHSISVCLQHTQTAHLLLNYRTEQMGSFGPQQWLQTMTARTAKRGRHSERTKQEQEKEMKKEKRKKEKIDRVSLHV